MCFVENIQQCKRMTKSLNQKMPEQRKHASNPHKESITETSNLFPCSPKIPTVLDVALSANEQPFKTNTNWKLKETESCFVDARHFFCSQVLKTTSNVLNSDVNILIDSAESPNRKSDSWF